jgi:hypothetical protein
MIALGKKYRQPRGAACFTEPNGILDPRFQNSFFAWRRLRNVTVQDVEEQKRASFWIKMVYVHCRPS